MALRDVKLDDKYDLGHSHVFVTGFQALVRLCLMQKELDRRRGLNTAGYVTGYRGSPLGGLDGQFQRAAPFLTKSDVRFQPGAVPACSSPPARFPVWFELRVAEFDLASAVQEDTEPDQVGVRRDLGGDLILGPRAGSGGGGDVDGRVVPGIWAGRPRWRGLALAADAERQPGAAVRRVGAQFAAEGDDATAVVTGVDVLGEEGGSGRSGRPRPGSPARPRRWRNSRTRCPGAGTCRGAPIGPGRR